MDNTVKTIYIIFLLVLIFYLMSVLSSILIPLALAFLFAVLFQPFAVYMNEKLKAPNWLIMPIIAIFSLAVIYGLFNIIYETALQIVEQKEFLVEKFNEKVISSIHLLDVLTGDYINLNVLIEQFNAKLTSEWVTTAIGGLAQGLGSFTGSFFMFAIYYIVLLAGLSNYKDYLIYVGGGKADSLMKNYERIQKSIYRYVVLKVLINLALGVQVYIICLAFGIKFAIFWGFLTFLLHFIPSIGSILTGIPPLIMAIIQFNSIEKMLLLLVLLVAIQAIMGNLVEPKIMGSRLKLNTLTVLFGLVFWGYIWGVPGMILSVPLMVFIKLLFEHIPSLQIVARVMGSPDELDEEGKKKLRQFRKSRENMECADEEKESENNKN